MSAKSCHLPSLICHTWAILLAGVYPGAELRSTVFTQETSHLGGAEEWYSTAYKDPGFMWTEGIDLKDLC